MRDLTPLCLLAKKYETDKGGRHLRYGGGDSSMTHEYTPIYWDLLHSRRESARNVLELGINSGASLRMWREFFPNAQIVGLDSSAACLVQEDRITSYACDCGDIDDTKRVQALLRNVEFDLIVDDASHFPEHQGLTVKMWSHRLTPDGILVIEDIGRSHERLLPLLRNLPEGFYPEVRLTDPITGGDRQPENLFLVRRDV